MSRFFLRCCAASPPTKPGKTLRHSRYNRSEDWNESGTHGSLKSPICSCVSNHVASFIVNANHYPLPQKRAGSESLPSQLSGLCVPCQLSTNGGSNDDGGGGNSNDARRTSSTMVHNRCHSKDMVGSIHTDNSRIRNPDSQFRPKSERQNAARERKPIHLPPMLLREAFSYSFPFLFLVLPGMEAPAKDFLDALKMRVSL
jgi:hypothetical protein